MYLCFPFENVIDDFRYFFSNGAKVSGPSGAHPVIALQSGTTSIDRELFEGYVKPKKFDKKPQTVFDKQVIDELLIKFPEQHIFPNSNYNQLFTFLGANKFFSFLIPEKYGGKKTSVEEMSDILTYITSANPSLGVVTMVPNSLGPSELLLHYGTEEQKDKYLPKLANGDKIQTLGWLTPGRRTVAYWTWQLAGSAN